MWDGEEGEEVGGEEEDVGAFCVVMGNAPLVGQPYVDVLPGEGTGPLLYTVWVWPT